jgi:hypothetical protein
MTTMTMMMTTMMIRYQRPAEWCLGRITTIPSTTRRPQTALIVAVVLDRNVEGGGSILL